LVFGKIIKIVATRCQILRLYIPKSISDPLGELTALPRTHGIKGLTSKQRGGVHGGEGEERKTRRGEGIERKGKGWDGKGREERGRKWRGFP